MANLNTLRNIASTFPESSEEPHFENTSFRVGKKIFATYSSKDNYANIKLSILDQDVFSSMSDVVFPVDNKWGRHGWTSVLLDDIQHDLLKDLITTAYCTVAPLKLAKSVRSKDV